MFDFPKLVSAWQAWLAAILLFLGFTLPGCSFQEGTGGIWDKSEPQTKFEISPVSKKMRYFSNEGRSAKVELAEIEKKENGWKFKVEGLVLNEKNVEIRGADKEVLAGQWTGSAQLATAHWEGAKNLVVPVFTAAMPAVTEYIKAHPASAKDPSILQGVLKSAMDQVISGGLKPDGTPLVPIKLPGQ